MFFWIESCLNDQQHSDSQQGSLQKREKTRQEALKKAQRNALKENSGWEVKLVKLPTASLCRRRVCTDFSSPALRGGEESFAEHEKQNPAWKTFIMDNFFTDTCSGMRQNEWDTEEITETEWRDEFGGISQQKSHQKLWIQEQARGNRRYTLVWAWNQGLGMAELEDCPITEFTQQTGVISASSLLDSSSSKIFKIGLIMNS